MLSRRRHP